MQQLTEPSPSAVQAEHQMNLRDLQQEALELLLAATSVAGFGVLLLGIAFAGAHNLGFVGILLMLLPPVIQGLLERHYLARVWLLLTLWLVSIVLTALLLPTLPVFCLLALPVGLAVFCINERAGLTIGAAASVAAVSLARAGYVAVPLSGIALFLLAAWGVFILSWLLSRPLVDAMHWSWQKYAEANRQLETARHRQAELNQAVQDLAEANVQMARLTDLLASARQAAEDAERARAEFVANVSHELRTPLNMILGFAEMIVEAPRTYGAKLPPALLADVAAIQRNSQHLASLINDVLDMSQIEAQRMTLRREWTSLADIIQAAVLAVQPLFDSRGLYLETHLPPDLPDLYCDRTRIRQVLLNLLNNAARFTEKGGVSIEAAIAEKRVTVTVTDTGPGIAQEDIPKLFEPFRQLDGSLRRQKGGSGLGLNISRRFVELHGGRMGVRSSLGEGSSFWFSLPLSSPPPDVDMATRFLRSPYETRRHSTLTPKPQIVPRVVVLEAQDVLASATRRYLDGVDVVAAGTPQEARVLLSAQPAQALLIRGESPQQATAWVEEMHSDPHATPVVALSLPASRSDGGQAIAGHLTKPVTRAQLLQAITDVGTPVRSILLTDDDPEALQLFTRLLSSGQKRYRVLQAGSGPEALELMRSRHPDLLLLDLVMPGMDGLTVLAEKNRDPEIRDIPVLILSAQDPSGQPIVAPALTVTRSGGLSLPDLLRCTMAVSEILMIARPGPAPVPQAAPAA